MEEISQVLREDLNFLESESLLTEINLLSNTNNAKNYMAANIYAKEYAIYGFNEEMLITDIQTSLKNLNKIVEYIGQKEIDVFVDDLLFREFVEDIKFQEDILLVQASNTIVQPHPRPDSLITAGKKKEWKRDSSIAKESLLNSDYKCEIDNTHVTFISLVTNQNYVEAHHLIPINRQDDFEYSIDVPGNIISLCPNCHREVHHAITKNKKEIITSLYHKRSPLLEDFGLL
ncbi:MrcB family domain-containing protein [Pseudogracilibacillus auburnensis]|uniref:Uncharacterized protein DUF3578 n=1 Tax=Pseudogracilibacillus auburnensis TaxID=1494959 RepID=A0A2V3VL61_9BACI|nr:DUF3578 domain-containing protein [Pseudogracilibacillus auburnensis]PXW81641.1 uncharacterized protein DUF3578 [Pseudogracilibacillus auburnensis]